MSHFYEIEPSPENYWRAIILFGRNTTSYKFALAKALLDLSKTGENRFDIDRLAKPYAAHLCEHLKRHPKQGTNSSSNFLKRLREYNIGKLSHEEVIEQTVRHGFRHVLDAFHNVHSNKINTLFFVDERKSGKGILLTDDFLKLRETLQFSNLSDETEARWQLVESAWENNISKNLMLMSYEKETEKLIGITKLRRINVTSARHALNGYQKGRCFYCYREISIAKNSDNLTDVDHFYPNRLKMCDVSKPVDGVANLVLACRECNRGVGGKFDQLPSVELLERLYKRNEYLISSSHPLRETLISQTGNTAEKRQQFLQAAHSCASLTLGSHKKWNPKPQGVAIF